MNKNATAINAHLTIEHLRRAKNILNNAPVPDLFSWPVPIEDREALIERRRKDNADIILKMFGVNKC